MTYLDFLLNYAKREFKIAKCEDTELSKAMLNFLEVACNHTNNEPENIKKIINMLNLLVDMHPIVEITEDDFVEEVHQEDGKEDFKILRCTRYEHVYKEDGRYWNDRAIGFRRFDQGPNDIMFTTQGHLSSKQEIQLPYFPTTRVVMVESFDEV